ncbi:hypothetical protein O181_118260 [Austropuccinia psidii MF-1]|uniref:Uncharacterized protein n=1 Tax=Austropuccinia psidii MF-1 TaxID=1389203 RepID=A0A9Q3KG14_9BASI|nr:hypothetical protein [Austropuccinia psidii MF-1]
MPICHSPPTRQARSRARTQAILTPTARAPLDGTPEFPQLQSQFDRGPHGPGEYGEEEEENSVEEEESDGSEGVPAPVRASQGTGGPTLAQSDNPVSHESEPCLLAIMQEMTQIMPNFPESSSYDASNHQPQILHL